MASINQSASQRAYHLTRRDRIAGIMRDGLRTDADRLLTEFPSPEQVRLIYGCVPVFVSRKPWVEREQYNLLSDFGVPGDFVLLSVNIDGLPLAADVMSLSGKGAYLEDDHLWFEEDSHPLRAWVDPISQTISYARLVTEPELIAAANHWTGTMAVMTSIGPERISIVG